MIMSKSGVLALFFSIWILLAFVSLSDSSEVSSLDENVVAQWSNITVHVKRRQILSMGQGALYKSRLVGMLGPSGR